MIKIIGYKCSEGVFTPPDGGGSFPYDNRLIRCITDENLDDFVFGYEPIELKIKTRNLAKSFRCTVEDVNDFLESVQFSEIQPIYATVKKSIECVGFTVLKQTEGV